MLISLKSTLLLLLIATTTLAYRCPETLTNCSCETSECGGYLFSCPPYNHTKLRAQFCQKELSVQCTEQSESYFNIIQHFNYPHVSTLRYSSCHLSKNASKSLEGYMEVIGTGLIRLEFISNKDLSGSLNSHFLNYTPNLQHLSLSNNNLTFVPGDLLKNTPHLVSFTLQDRTIESVPSTLFNFTRKVKGIELGINSLMSIPQNLFNGLDELVHLNLESNQLTSISQNHLPLPNLKVLDLHSNNLSSFHPNVFTQLPQLQTLSLFGNKLTKLSEETFSANQRLKILKLHRNQLSTISAKLFKDLNRLDQLFLDHNGIKEISVGAFDDLTILKNLTLNNNKLLSLPDNIFGQLKNLTFLDLSYNNLIALSSSIFQNNSQLQYLKLNNNNISIIAEDSFESLVKLVHLEIQHNNIKGFLSQTFAHNPRLQYIDASFNHLSLNSQLTMFLVSPFHSSSELRHILLSHNNYNMFTNDWVGSMLHLETLDLRYNNFTSLSSDQLLFVSNKRVTIYLEHNNIKSIDMKSLAVNDSTMKMENVEVFLNDNPINCNCIMYDFHNFISELSSRDPIKFHINNLVCDKPDNLKGALVSHVKPCDFKCYEDLERQCPGSCHCYYQTCSRNFVVNCSNANLTTLPELYPLRNTVLHLEYNQITDLQLPEDYNYSQVKSIHLSNNRLSSINITYENFPNLEALYLDHNNFTMFPSILQDFFENVNQSHTFNVSMGHNPWMCSCDNLDLHKFVIKFFSNITDYEDVVCNGTSRLVVNRHVDDFCPPYSRAILIASIIIVSMAGMVCTVMAIMYYRYGVTLKIWLFAHKCCLPCITEEDIDNDKVYDAFISYSHEDEDFIVKELVPQLEEQDPKYNLCLHYRDWLVGVNIQEQVLDSVQTSKRTVIVLSNNFLRSVWGRLEFRAAHMQALQDNINRVVMIVYGDVPAKEDMGKELCMYINTKTYLKWGDPWFWEKLRWALPHPQNVSRPRFFRNNNEDNLELVQNMANQSIEDPA